MALNLEQKKSIVSEVAEVASSALSAVAAEYKGLSSVQMTNLRAAARQEGVYVRVVKNNLARRAVAGTEFECMQQALVGSLVLAFSMSDPGAAARVMKEFVKTNKQMEVKLVSVGGKLFPASDLDRLSKMPTKLQAISMLMSVIKAPVQKLASTINEVPSKLVRTLAAVRDQKEAA
jgi:large subunit ribosomal protein L10